MSFAALNLAEQLLLIINKKGFSNPTPIQEKTIGCIIEGKDIIGYAQTGTGKTFAYLLPLFNRLIRRNNPENQTTSLIIAPTRELAIQIKEECERFYKELQIYALALYGGTQIDDQVESLKKIPTIIIATPGRLVDLLERQALSLSKVDYVVLDEADQMFQLGFQEDLQKIFHILPPKRQTILFSATKITGISEFTKRILDNPIEIEVLPESIPLDLIDQKIYFVEASLKFQLLIDFLRSYKMESTIIFTKTRKGANLLYQKLIEAGISTDRIHSDRSQQAREQILTQFKNKELQILIATDIAARGLDISHISHIFNYELPQNVEAYVHRIGRTGRAGKTGIAISLCTPNDKEMLAQIQKHIKYCIPVVENHTYATLSLKKALAKSEEDLSAKNKAKKVYRGSKANGDFFRRQKREQRKGK